MARTAWSTVVVLVGIASGVLLSPLAFLSYISGYCLHNPQLVGLLTYNILGDMELCGILHTVILPPAIAIIGVIHAMTTAITIYRRVQITKIGWLLGYAYLIIISILSAIVVTLAVLGS